MADNVSCGVSGISLAGANQGWIGSVDTAYAAAAQNQFYTHAQLQRSLQIVGSVPFVSMYGCSGGCAAPAPAKTLLLCPVGTE